MSLLFFTPKQFRFHPEKVDLDTNFDSRYDREPIPKDLGYFFPENESHRNRNRTRRMESAPKSLASTINPMSQKFLHQKDFLLGNFDLLV